MFETKVPGDDIWDGWKPEVQLSFPHHDASASWHTNSANKLPLHQSSGLPMTASTSYASRFTIANTHGGGHNASSYRYLLPGEPGRATSLPTASAAPANSSSWTIVLTCLVLLVTYQGVSASSATNTLPRKMERYWPCEVDIQHVKYSERARGWRETPTESYASSGHRKAAGRSPNPLTFPLFLHSLVSLYIPSYVCSHFFSEDARPPSLLSHPQLALHLTFPCRLFRLLFRPIPKHMWLNVGACGYGGELLAAAVSLSRCLSAGRRSSVIVSLNT